MQNPFDYFVVFAEMRTGSNFLETNLNAFESITCHGEAFNPHFIGYPNKSEILGVSLEQRTENPFDLLDAVKSEEGVLAGFRYFHDHDPRILQSCLDDPRCAKVILTRNPVDSYVSWKIAQATGQWKLTDVRRRRESKVHFDPLEFQNHVQALQDFQVTLMRSLQVAGQTAFYIAYEDLQDVAVLNGLARHLGQEEQLEALDTSLKRQNPSPVSAKVSNFDDIPAALSALDQFNLTRTPNFEPRRGAAVPTYAAAAETPLLYLPVRSGPEAQVMQWLADLDGVQVDGLHRKLNQKALRQWKRAHKGHRSFTVIRHPVARAHSAFCSQILATGSGSFAQIRKVLRKVYKLPLPAEVTDTNYDVASHRAAFIAFLEFLMANLAGQTSVRVDAHWATQASILKGFGEMALPDMIVREDEMDTYLAALAAQVGRYDAPDIVSAPDDTPYSLDAIYDDSIEKMVKDIYQRDYLMFGFDRWA